MIDHPAAPDLLVAMAATLTDEVMPELVGPPQHAARVVANLCRILAREWESGSSNEAQTVAELGKLLGADAGPAAADLAHLVGRLDVALAENPDQLSDGGLHTTLVANVERRLAIAKPEYR